MDDGKNLIIQSNNAFNFIEKLFFEISYLIKEIEGILSNEEENFLIARPSGYSISARSSTGLESNNVPYWLLKNFSVTFIPEIFTKLEKGQTITNFSPDLKVIFFRFSLFDSLDSEPIILAGIFNEIARKENVKWIKKYENIIGQIEYSYKKIFTEPKTINYSDSYMTLKGEYLERKLYSLKDSEAINKSLLTPVLKIFRK